MDHIILDWSKRNKLKARDNKLLLEAYRRYNAFAVENGRGITKAWLGLGTRSVYGKSKFFRMISNQTLRPRCNGWWVLTEDGIDVLVDLIRVLPWKATYNHILFSR